MSEPSIASGSAAMSAPDWSLVHFDVGCARCGHDLHGQTEPKCPACGLEFDWKEAVPLEELTCAHCGYHLYGLSETRCPECGERFTWAGVLADRRRRRHWLFEYRWRDRPVRSMVTTWLRSLWPRRFWRRIDIHDPPQIGPLWAVLYAGLILYFLMALLAGVSMELQPTIRRAWKTLSALQVARAFGSVINNTSFHQTWSLVVLWMLLSVAALLVFQQSMRRCRVRSAHVLRVWAYTVPTTLPLATLIFIGSVWLDRHFWTFAGLRWVPTLVGANVLFVVWSTRRAYRDYLRMKHSWAIALTAQVIAVMGVFGLGGAAIQDGPTNRVLFQIYYQITMAVAA